MRARFYGWRERLQTHEQIETGALSDLALQPDSSPHHRSQPGGYGEAETCASILAVVDESAWVKGEKMDSRFCAGMPIPVSETVKSKQ